MLSSGKRLLTLAVVMAANALVGRGDAALRLATPGITPRPERKPKAKQKKRRASSRFTWMRWRVPAGGGEQEVERRRRQIEAGTLLTTAGHERLRALHRGLPIAVGADFGKPGDDLTVVKHIAMGKSEARVVIVE